MNVFKAIFQGFRKLLRNSNFKERLSINCFQLYLECVPRTISYHLYFLRICKVWSMLHQGQWNEFRIKKAILCLYILFSLFFSFFIKNCVFIISISFLDEVSNFRNRILTNQKPKLVMRNCQWNFMLTLILKSSYLDLSRTTWNMLL